MSVTSLAEPSPAMPPVVGNGQQLPQLLEIVKHLSAHERLTLAEAVIQMLKEDFEPLARRAQLRQRLAEAAEIVREDYESGAVTEYTGFEGEQHYAAR